MVENKKIDTIEKNKLAENSQMDLTIYLLL